MSLLSSFLGKKRATGAKRVGIFMAVAFPIGIGLTVLGGVREIHPLLVAGVVLIVLGALPLLLLGDLVNVLVLGSIRSAARRKAADRLGMTYSRHDPFAIDRLGFPALGDGAAEHVSWGSLDGRQVIWFEWSRGILGREGSFACAMVDTGADCPPLVVSRDRSEAGLLPEVELESVEFNRAFTVACPDRRFATAFCDAALMAWLLDSLPAKMTVEARGRHVLVRSLQRRRLPGVGWTMAIILTALGKADDAFDRVLTVLGGLSRRLPALLPSMWPATGPALHVNM